MAKNALIDFLQATSNAAAGNVSGPVDMLTWALRKAGLPVPSDAVGTSEWMAQRGLTKPVSNEIARLAGETVGMTAPIAAAAKAPQIARGLLQAGENASAPRTLNPQLGAVVYHGSPHQFDAFDSSKIGTGEGAQAYGHGLYLADSPGVAQGYQRALSGIAPGFKPDPKKNATQLWDQAKGLFPNDSARQEAWHALAQKHDWTDPVAVAKWGKEMAYSPEAASVVDDVISKIYNPGALYKVDLPDNAIARMLDWDKPLSQQAPEVQKALESVMSKRAAEAEAQRMAMNAQYPNRTTHPVLGKIANKPRTAFDYKGEAAVSSLVQELGGPDKAAAFLRSQGIPGIRYLDGGSRGAGAGTSNYVVFPGEESVLSILERNGQKVNHGR